MGETRELKDDAEITLGTGKLLGIFFGLAALCAVFFTMGYMLGRSSAALGWNCIGFLLLCRLRRRRWQLLSIRCAGQRHQGQHPHQSQSDDPESFFRILNMPPHLSFPPFASLAGE